MIEAAARTALQRLMGERVRFHALLGRFTSLGVGGPADALVIPEALDEAEALVTFCAEHDVPLYVLGGGFNTLVLDGGIEGVVLRTQRLREIEVSGDGLLYAEAGVSHSQVTRVCQERGLTGLEFSAGIPGSVGGWVTMNAGIPDHEIGPLVAEIRVATPSDGTLWIAREELRFEYRSVHGVPPGSVVLAAHFQLAAGEREQIRKQIDRHLVHRRSTQPIDQPSCGSVFKNPPGEHAGRLIESAGLKGAREGGAQISSLHANFIVNTGNATAADVTALIERARDAVREQSGIELETEVRIVGRPG
jgi:UDP-N-acetylmuramate dehydrogenase